MDQPIPIHTLKYRFIHTPGPQFGLTASCRGFLGRLNSSPASLVVRLLGQALACLPCGPKEASGTVSLIRPTFGRPTDAA